jgi:hypothetical protein
MLKLLFNINKWITRYRDIIQNMDTKLEHLRKFIEIRARQKKKTHTAYTSFASVLHGFKNNDNKQKRTVIINCSMNHLSLFSQALCIPLPFYFSYDTSDKYET